ncbi:MAG: tetratricopeptide repeat protein [Prevotella sp.]|nr:tetratricopeptide repeat protein [Prevotella sp.]
MKKKHLSLLFLCLMTTLSTFAQRAQTLALDSTANRLFMEKNYEKSLAIRKIQLNRLKSEVGDSSYDYIMRLIQVGKCYYRMMQPEKAEEAAQQVVDLYGQYKSTSDEEYAFALDNLALYQGSLKKSAEGLKNAEKALEIYQNFYKHNHDIAIMYAHVAELAHDNGDNAKAIRQELMSLNVFKNLYGEHSEDYISEARYLQKYYEANGDKEKAKALADRLETLEKETKEGVVDLPKPMEFTSDAVAHEHNNDARRCAEYYLTHYINANKMNDAAAYIMAWSQATSDSHVVIGENEGKLINNSKTLCYGVAYIAGCSLYALKTGMADFTFDTFQSAMVDMLNFYNANKKITGEVKYLEQYVKAYGKGADNLVALLKKNFPGNLTEELITRIKNGEKVKIQK